MNRRRLLMATGIVAVMLLAGCTGALPGGGDGGSGDGGSGGTSNWCVEGETRSWANPTSGETASLEIQGVEEHNGRETCKAVWETNSGRVQRIEMYFTQDNSYQHVIMYDGSGTKINEYEVTGGGSP